MKIKMTILISLVIFTIASLDTANAGNPKTTSIDKLLNKEISYPDFAKQQKLEGFVLVNFTVNSDGTICVNLTNESDANLKDYIVGKLMNLKIIPSKENTSKTYDVKFEFKREK
ncbi:MAG: hypothetical protein WC868_00050 [Bacteroidales bacterium]